MQVYRRMNIGTAKPSAADRQRVPHHLIDLVEPDTEFTLAEFQAFGVELLDRAGERPVVLAGGTGLYFRSLVDPMSLAPTDETVRAELEATPNEELAAELVAADPGAAEHLDLANPHRVIRAVEVLRISGATPSQRVASDEYRAWSTFQPLRPFVAVGVDPGPATPARIERRFDEMLQRGLLDEVASLRGSLGRTASQAVGYKELMPVVAGEMDLPTAREAAISATRALAKRQRTYFGKDPRIRWIEWDDDRAIRLDRMRRALELDS